MRLLYSFLLVLFVIGCSKDDDSTPSGGTGGTPVNPSAPVITILGSNPFNLELRSTFTDPGATALDAEQGNMTSSMVIHNYVNNNLPGDYRIDYLVTDSTGLKDSASRNVNVFATAQAMNDMYNVHDTIDFNGTLIPYNYNQFVFPTTQNSIDTLRFSSFADYNGNVGIYAIISSSGIITLPLQTGLNIGTLNEDHQFQGQGYVTATGFYLEYTDKNLSIVPPATVNCRAHFTR